MSTYRNEYCPFCKSALTIHERSEFFDYNRYIGLQYERCPNCNNIYSTNRKLYSEMNEQEKSNISSCYFFNIISVFCTLYGISILLVILIAEGLFKVNIGDIVSYVFISPILPCIILGYLLAKKRYKALKELSIENFTDIDYELKEINSTKHHDDELLNLIDVLQNKK